MCGDQTNAAFASTPTDVHLGTVSYQAVSNPGSAAIGGQSLKISTNAAFGYVVTATSSGHLLDPSTGYWMQDAQGTATGNNTPNPAVVTTGVEGFGVHPCSTSAGVTIPNINNAGQWGSSPGTGGTTGNHTNNVFANPSASYYYLLASRGTRQTAQDTISVEYMAEASTTTPAGSYRTTITYVVTPTF